MLRKLIHGHSVPISVPSSQCSSVNVQVIHLPHLFLTAIFPMRRITAWWWGQPSSVSGTQVLTPRPPPSIPYTGSLLIAGTASLLNNKAWSVMEYWVIDVLILASSLCFLFYLLSSPWSLFFLFSPPLPSSPPFCFFLEKNEILLDSLSSPLHSPLILPFSLL